MSQEIAVKAESISKVYKLYNSRRSFVKEALSLTRKKYHKDFYALKNISFSVKKGEMLGIIGQNGSGKSTLLKILASIVTPTTGKHFTRGTTRALIELQGGFDESLTGIENVKFLGILQGYTRKEMEKRMPQILEFAEIGDYAYQPVKNYSSGMNVRLAFSIAIHVDPEILIVDEALAVGDIRFQQKCYRRINELKNEGKTIVLCTHGLDTVKEFCDRAIWLHNGEIKETGDPAYVTDLYRAFMVSQETITKKAITEKSEKIIETLLKNENTAGNLDQVDWFDISSCKSYGNGSFSIKTCSLLNRETNESIRVIRGGEKVRILLYVTQHKKIDTLGISILLGSHLGSPIFKINSHAHQQQIAFELDTPSIVSVDFTFPHLGNGQYTMSMGAIHYGLDGEQIDYWVHDAVIINVDNPEFKYKLEAPLVLDEVKMTIQKLNI
jgi:ABC-type polysaccharide/polyol phosphate transport system ATPase subunit